ncbi:uncharacterized protein [Physcomitrium patens]
MIAGNALNRSSTEVTSCCRGAHCSWEFVLVEWRSFEASAMVVIFQRVCFLPFAAMLWASGAVQELEREGAATLLKNAVLVAQNQRSKLSSAPSPCWSIPRDDVHIPEEHSFYEPVYCTGKGCNNLARLWNKFRYISFSHVGCAHCYPQTCPYTPDMMAPEPVTMLVKIYDRTYSVICPSEQRMKDLMLEFATQCRGRLKPTGGRRFFICIHCRKSTFSNKLMLNQHRFEKGCESAKYPDEIKALLLPYPDFLPRQGKIVEGMQKCASTKGKKKSCSETVNTPIKEEETIVEDEELGAHFVGLPPSKKQKGRVTEDEASHLVETVVPSDLFFEAAPLELEKAILKGKKGKKAAAFV